MGENVHLHSDHILESSLQINMFTSGITARRLARVWRGTVIPVKACPNWNTGDFLRSIEWGINGEIAQESRRGSTRPRLHCSTE